MTDHFNFQDPEALFAFELDRNWKAVRMMHGASLDEMRAFEAGFKLGRRR